MCSFCLLRQKYFICISIFYFYALSLIYSDRNNYITRVISVEICLMISWRTLRQSHLRISGYEFHPYQILLIRRDVLTLFSEGLAPFLSANFWSLFTVTKVNTVPHALQFGRVLNWINRVHKELEIPTITL